MISPKAGRERAKNDWFDRHGWLADGYEKGRKWESHKGSPIKSESGQSALEGNAGRGKSWARKTCSYRGS